MINDTKASGVFCGMLVGPGRWLQAGVESD